MTPTTRRAVLHAGVSAGAMALLSGCGLDWRAIRIDTGASEKPPTFTADDLARFAAIERISTLATQAKMLAGSTPAADGLSTAHTAQLAQLGELPGPVPSASVTPKNWPSSPAEAPTLDPLGLVSAERQASVALLSSVEDLGGRVVRLLSSVAVGCWVGAAAFAQATKVSPPQALTLPTQASTITGPLPPEVARAAEKLIEAHDFAGYAYAPYAGALPEASRGEAATMMTQHTRDAQQLRALLHSAGTEAPAAPAAYAVSLPADEAAARKALAEAERACASTAGDLLATGDKALRPITLATLLNAASQQWHWSGEASALPGLA